MEARPISLDDWYKLLNNIYLNRNYYRSRESIFTHLIEVIGGLSGAAVEKAKVGPDAYAALAKALGWWMSLCGKVGVQSIEEVLWTKFPLVCPYCQLERHDDEFCKNSPKGKKEIVWATLAELREKNKDRRPKRLRDWQKMFSKIYPGYRDETKETIFGRLAQELGEFAEGTRLLQISQGYFINEASDVFARLMRYANHEDAINGYEEFGEKLEEALWEEYPGQCKFCGSEECRCQPILYPTLGRLSKTIPPEIIAARSGFTLFSHEQMVEKFRLGDQKIMFGDEEQRVSIGLLMEIATTNREILTISRERGVILPENLERAINDLTNQVSKNRISQEKVNEVLQKLDEAPSDIQKFVMEFLTNVSAGLWTQALLMLVSR